MGRKSGHNKPYQRKGGGKSFKYKWGPFKDLPKDIDARNAKRKKREKEVPLSKRCTATPFSQGIDNVVKYVYNDAGPNNHLAYVECNYVK